MTGIPIAANSRLSQDAINQMPPADPGLGGACDEEDFRNEANLAVSTFQAAEVGFESWRAGGLGSLVDQTR